MRKKLIALAVSAAVAGCNLGSNESGSRPPPPVDDSAGRSGRSATGSGSGSGGSLNTPQGRSPDPVARPGLSGKQKIVMLGGAAALYYLYKHHQNAQQGQGSEGQYYLSKNGRVYYRDSEHRAHWVTPPQEGIAVPQEEAGQYSQFQGYNNQSSGRDLSGLADDSNQ